MVHQEKMQLYRDRFEEGFDQKDLWRYICHKISNGGENLLPKAYKKPQVEADEAANMTSQLRAIVEDGSPEEKAEALKSL